MPTLQLDEGATHGLQDADKSLDVDAPATDTWSAAPANISTAAAGMYAVRGAAQF